MNTERYDFSNFINQLEEDFYKAGPLNGAFFDLKYNFIERDPNIDNLLAWDSKVKETLWSDIITFQKAMPKLKELGLSNSRGVILAGPPGTGKTMIAKWLAAHSDITCILISAEMITGRQDIKKCYELARKVSPTLLIIEDIDTAGALDRRACRPPTLLGEFLQSMDGVVPNHGVITLATTNHSNKIDPAIADRPGRFRPHCRGWPAGQGTAVPHHPPAPETDGRRANGEPRSTRALWQRPATVLTGAWLREVVQTALIATSISGRARPHHEGRPDSFPEGRAQAPRNGLPRDPIRSHRRRNLPTHTSSKSMDELMAEAACSSLPMVEVTLLGIGPRRGAPTSRLHATLLRKASAPERRSVPRGAWDHRWRCQSLD